MGTKKKYCVYLVYLVQVTLVVSTEGMDAPAVQQWKFSLWGFVPGNARVYYILKKKKKTTHKTTQVLIKLCVSNCAILSNQSHPRYKSLIIFLEFEQNRFRNISIFYYIHIYLCTVMTAYNNFLQTFYNMTTVRLQSLTLRISSRSFSDISGNSILWEGSVMACSLAIWFVMLWNGVFPYVMQYRMHPRDHTSPLGLIFKDQETTISVL